MEKVERKLENNKFATEEHTGTHIDAPSHFRKGGWRMHEIAVNRLVGEGVVIDVSAKVKDNMYGVTVGDLEEWESQHGRMPDNAIVLINSGWASRYPDWKKVFNSDNLMELTSYTFPVVTVEAATWLAEERTILALGVDTPSPDLGNDRNFPVHQALLPKNILIIESVASLKNVPPSGSTIVMGALKLYDGSGAPMRLMALSAACRPPATAVLLSVALTVGLAMMRSATVFV
ncbi:hypothetical protein ACOMHN_027925 [Nucella lapillus]